MSLKDEIIFVLLNTTDYISGEELAKKFGKSRAAVWKSIKKLISEGYEIDAVTNKGYRLIESCTKYQALHKKRY